MSDTITIVSGLPRSGTSMMMKMLEAGGLEVVSDHLRRADVDNPLGYYEFERVKKIEEDQSWLPDTQGKVVKMVSTLLQHLPRDYDYKIVFMQRDMEELIASQNKMLQRLGKEGGRASDDVMAGLFQKHLREVKHWLAQQPNMETLYVPYNNVVRNPAAYSQQVGSFLGRDLNLDRMIATVDTSLYRNKASMSDGSSFY